MSLTGDLRNLPLEKSRAAIEVSATLAGVSLRVSKEFLQAVPNAAKVLSADDIRSWSEIGRKLAMGNADLGANFFAEGVDNYSLVPPDARPLAFQICLRQLVLSTSVAIETFKQIPLLAEQVSDDALFTGILKVGLEVAQRSAKHSSDFLNATPKVATALKDFDDRKVSDAAIALASHFAARTGGMTSDMWSLLPDALKNLSVDNAVKLLTIAEDFLVYGGSVTLNFTSTGGEILRNAPEVFTDWCAVLHTIAAHGNAVLVSFIRSGPQFFRHLVSHKKHEDAVSISRRVLSLVGEIAESDAESALACFRSSAGALKKVSLLQFEDWVRAGLKKQSDFNNNKAQRSYFALETRQSNDLLHEGREGLPLEKVQTTLRLYIEALTGREVEIAPLAAVPQESRLSDGRMIYLPSLVSEFKDDELDFRLFKVLAAHAAGQIEFGTYAKDTAALKGAYTQLSFIYEDSLDARDAFSLDGYINDFTAGEKALSPEEEAKRARKRKLPKDSDYRAVLQVFPEPALARKIFGTLENGRVDRALRNSYKGLVRDLDLMVSNLREKRPLIFDLPIHQVPFELLFQITLTGGALDDARRFYTQIVGELESVVFDYLGKTDTTVADTLIATSRIYALFQNIAHDEKQQKQEQQNEEKGEEIHQDSTLGESVLESQVKRQERQKKQQDARDLFNAWNNLEEDEEPDDMDGAEAWSHSDVPEQALESGDVAFAYDEWDRDLMDHRLGWCRVVEKQIKQGDRNFVEMTRSRYSGVISSIRRQFQLMKPENLAKIHKEIDGEEFDLNAVIDYVIDRRADGMQSDRLYTKRLRRQRDVAVSLLLDQSSSTARTITRNPLQPYTHPGRRIIEIEKEGLILMAEALEAVGDVYSIYGFTSEGRRNVKFYMVKDFNERYSEEIERRIGGISFQNNTRLGAAIRHAAAKLQRQEARTKLLILLTDGRPYDHDYGDARYAREDVRESLTEARLAGITPFCITIDRDSEAELKDLYGDVGYTIIDDVLSLPERLPNIYRRLTS